MAEQSHKPEQSHKTGPDPTALAHAYAEIAQRSSQLMTEYMKRQKTSAPSAFGDELGIAKAFYEMTGHLFKDPAKFAAMQMQLWQDYMGLWQSSMLRLFGGQHARPVIEP